ncbi:putative dehydrogenase [Paenibacillus sp. SORGH_AS306]|uniref:Gfo/Idh/MocA family protein n=1 Tax=unclassified Paenibacillus TaxID=185978 RepID=UPI0027844E86|nr:MULTISPECIES: Gfo/Idh/MocA family oxidoreductase [unclassified Paenibacillus]MDQ1234122.1 putative dehydrogenase [Paenibacillus sp. SORGH_AS_0306]MDR6111166.1 putative dehydrogenase [Paenibacillus sp. SORGH_AS_0338]
MTKKIKVGIIGGSVNNGWANSTHIPAVQHLEEYELTAVATSNKESATKSAEAFKATHGFDQIEELVQHPDVDMVVVSINVKEHYHAVKASIPSGKPIYSEWPLGSTTEEAIEMQQWVAEHQIPTAIGLQARQAPAIKYVKDLLKEGYVGKVLSAQLRVSMEGMGGTADQSTAYLFDRTSGGNLLTIVGGHNIDAFTYMVGDFAELSATTAQQYTQVALVDTQQMIEKTTDDQILVTGKLKNGAAASIHIQGGVKHQKGVTLEIFGDQGTIVLYAPKTIQFGAHELLGANSADAELQELTVPDDYYSVPDSLRDDTPVLNIAQVYRAFAQDLQEGTSLTSNFADAVKVHQLIDAIQKSAQTGERQYFK